MKIGFVLGIGPVEARVFVHLFIAFKASILNYSSPEPAPMNQIAQIEFNSLIHSGKCCRYWPKTWLFAQETHVKDKRRQALVSHPTPANCS